jgi:peptide-methionine (S)-S-oxide reductase
MRIFAAFLAGLLVIAGLAGAPSLARADGQTAKAILAGGCFWCMEHDFRMQPGAVKVVSGYSGGSIANPNYENYEAVSTANPVAHSEVIEFTYDTSKVTYAQVLDYYFRHIDPTDGGGQFCDRGAQYRPVIYFGTPEEKAIAEAKKADVAKLLKAPVAVDILPAKQFWPAEDYHQDYADKNPIKYKFYRWNCGRDQKVSQVWGAVAK